MAHDDFFRLLHLILYTVQKAMMEGRPLRYDEISAEELVVPGGYLAFILEDCIEDEHLANVTIKNGDEPVIDMRQARLTIKGAQFLRENSQMKAVGEYLKTVK